MARSYYQILGVSPGASDDEIRRAYRELAKRWHPDVNPSRDAAEQFRQVRAAYEVLADPPARAAYDRAIAPAPLRFDPPGPTPRWSDPFASPTAALHRSAFFADPLDDPRDLGLELLDALLHFWRDQRAFRASGWEDEPRTVVTVDPVTGAIRIHRRG